MKGKYWLLSGMLSLSMALSGTLTVLAEGADAEYTANTEYTADIESMADTEYTADRADTGVSMAASAVIQEAASREMTVEYGNLRTLLKEGNLTLKKTIEDQEDSINAYQEMWDTMKWEQDNLEDKAEEMEDDADSKGMETAALYASNASMLKSSAKRIYNQIKNLTDEKSTRSIEKSADSYTYTAQTLMNSYNQMASNVKATEKSVNALEASYQSLVRKGQAGTATQAEVQDGQNRLEQARTSLASLKEQEKQLRFKLLNMLGLEDSESVSIGAIPEPDLSAIGAIDFEGDKSKAIGNDSNVQSQRHSKAVSTAEINQRFRQVDEAEGTAEASITAAYQELQAQLLQYQAALESYTGAELVYQSQKRRQAAGMLSNTEYLQGEADYAKSKAAKETASMNLVQAYESYCWEVKGIS